MTIDEAIEELKGIITGVSAGAVVRTQRRSAEEAILRVYAPADTTESIQEAVRDRTIALLTSEDLDVQVLVYDIETSLPPEESGA